MCINKLNVLECYNIVYIESIVFGSCYDSHIQSSIIISATITSPTITFSTYRQTGNYHLLVISKDFDTSRLL